MIDWYTATTAITARVQALPLQIDVFEHDVPDGYPVPTTSGTIKPYVILSYAGVSDSRAGGVGITGPQDDDFPAMFSAHSVASTDGDARYLNQQVLGWLVGWSPTGAGVIRPAFFAGIGVASKLSSPTRYSAAQAYRLTLSA